jgi:hypothetical protein
MFIWSCSIDYIYNRKNREVKKLRAEVKTLKEEISEEEVFYKTIITNYEFSYFIIKKKKLGYNVDFEDKKEEEKKKKQSTILGRIKSIFKKDNSKAVKMIEPMKLTEMDGVLTGSVVPVQIYV